MSAADMAKAEADLNARFAKLSGKTPASNSGSAPTAAASGVDETDLADRLAKLGPSKYPNVSEQPKKTQDLEVQMALDYARKHPADSAKGVQDPDVAALLQQINSGASDQALAQFITNFEGGTSTSASTRAPGTTTAIDNDEVAQIIQQAKEYARFKSDVPDDNSDKDMDSSSSVSESSSDEDSDSDIEDHGKKKSRKSASSKSKRKSRWNLF